MTRAYRMTAAALAEKRARMKALHADPEFKARMKALHADPEFNPLVQLSPRQKKPYQKAIRCGLPRDRAIAEVLQHGG